MFTNTCITGSCSISSNVVYKNNNRLFENASNTLSEFLVQVYQFINIKYQKFYKMDNLSKLGWLAAEILLQDRLILTDYQQEDIGIVLSNASASLDTDIKYFETTKQFASPALFVYTLPNIVMGEICIRHQFKGENAFFICEKFDAELLYNYVNILINSNILQVCICGWVEVFEEEYNAVLFLVEKKTQPNPILFNKENLNKIYQSNYGEFNL